MSVAAAAIADSIATTLAALDAAGGRDGAAAAVAIIVVSTGIGIMYVLCMLH